MSSKNKYYTPSVEEFHYGFRYEVYEQVSGNVKLANIGISAVYDWVKRTFELDDFELIEGIIDSDKVRVKSLDIDDAEELGWKEFIGENMRRLTDKDGDMFDFQLYSNGSIDISRWRENPFFEGKVRNYNELKDVMRMLEIEIK